MCAGARASPAGSRGSEAEAGPSGALDPPDLLYTKSYVRTQRGKKVEDELLWLKELLMKGLAGGCHPDIPPKDPRTPRAQGEMFCREAWNQITQPFIFDLTEFTLQTTSNRVCWPE